MDFTEDRDKLLDMLRNKYVKAAEKYGKKLFNLADLESRITYLMQTKGSLQIFFEQEMDFYHQLKEKGDENIEDERKRAEFHRKAEEIMAANSAKVSKYPNCMFDPAASFEIKHFTGGITRILEHHEAIMKYLFRGRPEWARIQEYMGTLERFHVPVNHGPTPFLKHYIKQIMGANPDSAEAVERKILQTGGLGAFRLMLEIDKLSRSMSRGERDMMIDLSHSRWSELDLDEKSYWSGKRAHDAMLELKLNLQNLLDDFRLTELVEHAYRQEGRTETGL